MYILNSLHIFSCAIQSLSVCSVANPIIKYEIHQENNIHVHLKMILKPALGYVTILYSVAVFNTIAFYVDFLIANILNSFITMTNRKPHLFL